MCFDFPPPSHSFLLLTARSKGHTVGRCAWWLCAPWFFFLLLGAGGARLMRCLDAPPFCNVVVKTEMSKVCQRRGSGHAITRKGARFCSCCDCLARDKAARVCEARKRLALEVARIRRQLCRNCPGYPAARVLRPAQTPVKLHKRHRTQRRGILGSRAHAHKRARMVPGIK